MIKYGIATCKFPVTLSEWGSTTGVKIKRGDKLFITYHEYNGTIGLTGEEGIELHCGPIERLEYFEEKWYANPETDEKR